MPADFYDLLDVSSDASPEELKRSYREKARTYHPDVNADDRSSDQFKAIRKAYEVLSDTSERKDYDRMGHRQYVEQRLDGLPGSKMSTSRGSSSTRQARATTTGRGGATSAQSSGRRRSTARAGGGTRTGDGTTSQRRKPRSSWGERTISEPGARAKAMRARERMGAAPLVVAALAYLAGLAVFLAASASALAAIAATATAGNVDALASMLLTNGFADPLSFVLAAVELPSPALVFPVGVVLFPLVLGATAWSSSNRRGWLWTACALGPFVGIGLAFGGFVPTVGLDLALYVLLPAVALLGSVALVR